MKRFYYHTFLFILPLLIWAASAHGQNSKANHFAAGLSIGTNLPQTSVQGSPGVDLRASFLYVPIPLIGISPEVSIGTMSGEGPLKASSAESPFARQNYSFSNTYFYYGLTGLLNLQRVFSTNKPRTPVIPYFSIGAGYMHTSTSSEFTATGARDEYNYRLYTNHIGLLARVRMSRQLDLILGARYNFTQTYYLDAIPLMTDFDTFYSLHAGLMYKFGSANSQKDFIDWMAVNRVGRRSGNGKCPRFY
jgi:hypothetical protein